MLSPAGVLLGPKWVQILFEGALLIFSMYVQTSKICFVNSIGKDGYFLDHNAIGSLSRTLRDIINGS